MTKTNKILDNLIADYIYDAIMTTMGPKEHMYYVTVAKDDDVYDGFMEFLADFDRDVYDGLLAN